MIQESHCTEHDIKMWSSQWGGQLYYSNGSNLARGVMTLIRKGSDIVVNKEIKGEDGRYLIHDVQCQEQAFTLINAYAPNEDKPSFFTNLMQQADKCESAEYVLSGDLNIALNSMLDKSRGRDVDSKPYSLPVLMDIMDQYEMCDVWRMQNPNRRTYTWRKDSTSEVASRIDYFIISRSLMSKVQACNVESSYGYSDHCMLAMSLSKSDSVRGPGYWKFNSKLLYEKDFLDEMNTVIELATTVSDQLSPDERWEFIKYEITCAAQDYSIKKAKNKRCKFAELEEQIQVLQNMTNQLPFANPECVNNLNNLLKEYHLLVDEKVQSSIFRNKCKWYQQGERLSKYYFSLEKKHYNNKTMTCVHVDNRIITNERDIRKELAQHFQKLYTRNKNVKFDLQHLPGAKLTQKQHQSSNEAITLDELSLSLSAMQNGKTPGCDGISVEFYKCFWMKLRVPLYEAILFAIENGMLHNSARKGIITLIPKKNRDLFFIKNWRPLTMLNVDFKIFSKALASRMKIVLPDIISEDQTGFMQGRNIVTNVRRVVEYMRYTKKHSIKAVVLSIDFQSCFDLIDQEAIFQALSYFGFGEHFIHMIKLLFMNFQLMVQHNGYFSEAFAQLSGTHQGDPCASLLYLCCGEMVNRLIKSNPKITGVDIEGVRMLLSQFADDTDIFLKYDETVLNETLVALGRVESSLGLRINYDKTSVYRVGSLAGTNAKIYTCKPLAWTNDPINILGVVVSNDMHVQNENYSVILDKVKTITELWCN